ncbi:hypothetical protein LTR28_013885 [Elasticomyces elasticus]|nr:hypothetical protein LTR28_013885 [Elasticomyces elasticus]
MSVKDPAHMPPRCCTSAHIPLKHVENIFPLKFKLQWNNKYQEYTTANRIYCPVKGCGEWIKPSNLKSFQGRRYGHCTRCRTKVCAMCNGKWHTRRECPKDEELKKLIEVAKEKGWQRCCSCKAMVELKEGCNHMKWWVSNTIVDDRNAQTKCRLIACSLESTDDLTGRPHNGGFGVGNASGHFMSEDFVQNAAGVVVAAFGDNTGSVEEKRDTGTQSNARAAEIGRRAR